MAVKPATQLTTGPDFPISPAVAKTRCEMLLLHLEGGELPCVERGDPPRWVQPMYELSKDERPGEFRCFAVLR